MANEQSVQNEETAVSEKQDKSMARLAEILENNGIHVHQVLEYGEGWYGDEKPTLLICQDEATVIRAGEIAIERGYLLMALHRTVEVDIGPSPTFNRTILKDEQRWKLVFRA